MNTSTKPAVVVRDAAQAAAAAAANAAKKGLKSSEFWVSVGAGVLGTLAALLLPTPAGPIAALVLGGAAVGYSTSRGNVKAAALGAVNAGLDAAAGAGGVVGDVATVVKAVEGAAGGAAVAAAVTTTTTTTAKPQP